MEAGEGLQHLELARRSMMFLPLVGVEMSVRNEKAVRYGNKALKLRPQLPLLFLFLFLFPFLSLPFAFPSANFSPN